MMNPPQLANQLEHFERKFEESQSLVAKLQQRIESQEYLLQEQAHRIEQLEVELDKTETQVARVPRFDEQVSALKDELIQFIERRTGRSQAPADPTLNLSNLVQQLDNHTRTINELRREVEKMYRFDDLIELARTENSRLIKIVSAFQPKLDKLNREIQERTKPIGPLESQREGDRRLLTAIQAELPDLHRKADAGLTKVAMVEKQIPQYAKYEAALDVMREDIRRHREQMEYQIIQRERLLKNWNEIAVRTEQHIKENEAALIKYAEHHQLNKRALGSLQEFQERIQNEQHRFNELFRLAEERQRNDLEKFQADFEHRWQKRSVELEPRFVDLQRSIEAVAKRIEEVKKMHYTLEDQLSLLMQIVEEDILARTSSVMSWQKRFEEIVGNGQG
jgi:chromosome segregation ATPase